MRTWSAGEATAGGVAGMMAAIRFLWSATRGHRWRPARSPYLRWRLETFTGQRAETVRARDFLRLMWTERRQVLRFLRWLGEVERLGGERTRL